MKIVINGNPIAQARMRLFSRGGKSACFDPQGRDKALIKRDIRQFIDENFDDYKFPSCPQVSFIFHMPIPKFMLASKKKYARLNQLKHTSKPDVDNLIKLYFDCINDIAIQDDSKASIGFAVKFYSEDPKTIIYIKETSEVIEQPPGVDLGSSESCVSIHETIPCLFCSRDHLNSDS